MRRVIVGIFLTGAMMAGLQAAAVLASSVATEDLLLARSSVSPPQEPQATFKTGVEAITVSALVRDRRGRIVRNLTKADFLVYDTGVRRVILDVYTGDSPISLGVVLDISGSMALGGNMDRAREAVSMAMMNLRANTDEAALFTFDSVLQEVVPFTTDLDRVRSVSLEGRPWGATALFDAIAAASNVAAERPNRRRALLVITDGVDTGSRLDPEEVSAIARSIDVPVYLLAVVNPLDHPATTAAVLHAAGDTGEVTTLADLARWSAGDMRVSSMPSHTGSALREMFSELRHQYLITFEPGPRPGWHPLEVRTRQRDLIVHARSGYVAGPSRTGS